MTCSMTFKLKNDNHNDLIKFWLSKGKLKIWFEKAEEKGFLKMMSLWDSFERRNLRMIPYIIFLLDTLPML